MTKRTHGKLTGKTIELDEDPGFSQGEQIEVAVTVSPATRQQADADQSVNGDARQNQNVFDSNDLDRFCQENRIGGALEMAQSLARKHFRPTDAITTYLSGDPEWGERWVVVFVTTAGNVESASKAYDQFLREWIAASEWEARKLIRLSYQLG